MAPSISPLQALQVLISSMNTEQNKLSSVQQLKKEYAKAKEFLPEFEEWETSFGTISTENKALKKELNETRVQLQEQTNSYPFNKH